METYQHVCADLTVDIVHEDVELVKAPQRRTYCVPNGKQEAYGRKRLLSARKRLGVATGLVFPRAIRLDLDLELPGLVIKQELPAEFTLTEQVGEVDSGVRRDEPLEIPPFL